MSYEAAKTRAEPYNKIVEELPEIQLENVELVKRAVSEKRTAYVPVNNPGEGNAPLTIQALRNALQAAGPRLVRMTVTQVEERHLAAPARCSSRH